MMSSMEFDILLISLHELINVSTAAAHLSLGKQRKHIQQKLNKQAFATLADRVLIRLLCQSPISHVLYAIRNVQTTKLCKPIWHNIVYVLPLSSVYPRIGVALCRETFKKPPLHTQCTSRSSHANTLNAAAALLANAKRAPQGQGRSKGRFLTSLRTCIQLQKHAPIADPGKGEDRAFRLTHLLPRWRRPTGFAKYNKCKRGTQLVHQ